MLMRHIIEWNNKKQEEEAFQEPDQVKASAKSFVGYFVEGFCDGALLMYVPMLATCLYAGHVLRKNN